MTGNTEGGALDPDDTDGENPPSPGEMAPTTTDDAHDSAEGSAAEPDANSDWAAYLPIGITFLCVGIVFFLTETSRGVAWAFLPIGITFIALSVSMRRGTKRSSAAGS